MTINRQEMNEFLRDSKARMSEIKYAFGLNRRCRRKPREEDRRRKYTDDDDYRFWYRYRQLKCNQSALAREIGISQVAVRKRVKKIEKEYAESVPKIVLMLKMIYGEIPNIF